MHAVLAAALAFAFLRWKLYQSGPFLYLPKPRSVTLPSASPTINLETTDGLINRYEAGLV